MKNITVDVRHLEDTFGIDLHEFEGGHIYPLSKLMATMGFTRGTPQGRPRGNTKQEDTPIREKDQTVQEHSARIIHLEEHVQRYSTKEEIRSMIPDITWEQFAVYARDMGLLRSTEAQGEHLEERGGAAE